MVKMEYLPTYLGCVIYLGTYLHIFICSNARKLRKLTEIVFSSEIVRNK